MTIIKSLTQIVNEVAELESALIESGGEITPEIEALLEVKDIQLPAKIDAYRHIEQRLEVASEYWAAQAIFFHNQAQASKNAAKRLKDNLKKAMQSMERSEIEGELFKVKLQASRPSVVIDNPDILPTEMIIVETVKRPDKMAIFEAFKKGEDIPGAHLEPNSSLRFYPNKNK